MSHSADHGPNPAANPAADHAELATLRTSLEESTDRVVAVSDRYRETDDSAVAGDLDQAERSLVATRRAIDRALRTLARLT